MLINCLVYIDLNPVRAGIVAKPENYRWNSMGYHVQTGNKGDFFSLDFGLREHGIGPDKGRLEWWATLNNSVIIDYQELFDYLRSSPRFRMLEIMLLMLAKFLLTGKVTASEKGKATPKTATNILPGHSSEAAEFARRYDDKVKAFFNRKSSRTSVAIAYSALGHKLARAAYYIMRDNVEFNSKKLFT